MKIQQFQVYSDAKIGMNRSLVLNGYVGKTSRRLNEYVGFSHTISRTHS